MEDVSVTIQFYELEKNHAADRPGNSVASSNKRTQPALSSFEAGPPRFHVSQAQTNFQQTVSAFKRCGGEEFHRFNRENES